MTTTNVIFLKFYLLQDCLQPSPSHKPDSLVDYITYKHNLWYPVRSFKHNPAQVCPCPRHQYLLTFSELEVILCATMAHLEPAILSAIANTLTPFAIILGAIITPWLARRWADRRYWHLSYCLRYTSNMALIIVSRHQEQSY